MSRKEATIIQNFNEEKQQYEYFVKGYDVTESIKTLLKMYKEKYDKERRVFESTRGYLEAQQEYEKHIADLQSQLDQANEMIKLMYRDLLETGEWQKSMAVYRKEAEKKNYKNCEVENE